MDEHGLSIGPAAGMVRTLDDVLKAARSAATEITVGTISEKIRTGNREQEGPNGRVYYFDEKTGSSVNALGIPDQIAAEGYRVILPKMVAIAKAHSKQLRVSIGSFKDDSELARLQKLCIDCGVDEEEYNAGCPNIKDKNSPKVIPSYHAETLARQLNVFRAIGLRNVAVKISPIGNDLIPTIARVINKSAVVSRVIACNTEPDVEMVTEDNVTPALSYYGTDDTLYHVGGAAGNMLRDESLRVVRGMKKNLYPQVSVTGVGGIFEGKHVMQFRDVGADRYQVGTAYLQYGPKVLGDIASGAD